MDFTDPYLDNFGTLFGSAILHGSIDIVTLVGL